MTGGHKTMDKPIVVSVSLPASLVAKLRIILYDPIRKRTRYGALSGLVASLLEEWVKSKAGKHEAANN